jgi:hypothetical protein
MSFSSGTADTRENLLDLFRAFAITSGWTINRFAASGTGYVLNMQKINSQGDTMYANLRSVNNENLPGSMPALVGIVLSMSDGYDSAKDCVDQPGSPVNPTNANDFYATSIAPFTAVAKYWFFSTTGPDTLSMVILLPDGTYRHLIISEISELGAAMTKGYMMYGTNGMGLNTNFLLPFQNGRSILDPTPSTSWLRLSFDERNGWWSSYHVAHNTNYAQGGILGSGYRDALLLYNSLNQFSNSAALCPVNLYAKKLNGKQRVLGHLPHVRVARRAAFIVDQVYALGADDWMGFPIYSSTSDYALIYRKVV